MFSLDVDTYREAGACRESLGRVGGMYFPFFFTLDKQALYIYLTYIHDAIIMLSMKVAPWYSGCTPAQKVEGPGSIPGGGSTIFI